jgi:hypothetical protein
MRLSIWVQDKLGAHWRRIGVVEAQLAGPWPFKVPVSFREYALRRQWPRWHYQTMEVCEPPLFEVRR